MIWRFFFGKFFSVACLCLSTISFLRASNVVDVQGGLNTLVTTYRDTFRSIIQSIVYLFGQDSWDITKTEADFFHIFIISAMVFVDFGLRRPEGLPNQFRKICTLVFGGSFLFFVPLTFMSLAENDVYPIMDAGVYIVLFPVFVFFVLILNIKDISYLHEDYNIDKSGLFNLINRTLFDLSSVFSSFLVILVFYMTGFIEMMSSV